MKNETMVELNRECNAYRLVTSNNNKGSVFSKLSVFYLLLL